MSHAPKGGWAEVRMKPSDSEVDKHDHTSIAILEKIEYHIEPLRNFKKFTTNSVRFAFQQVDSESFVVGCQDLRIPCRLSPWSPRTRPRTRRRRPSLGPWRPSPERDPSLGRLPDAAARPLGNSELRQQLFFVEILIKNVDMMVDYLDLWSMMV